MIFGEPEKCKIRAILAVTRITSNIEWCEINMISGFLFTVFRCTIDILRQFEDLYVERKLGKFIYKSKSSYCVYNNISLDIILLNKYA